jgi:hypothetical protein
MIRRTLTGGLLTLLVASGCSSPMPLAGVPAPLANAQASADGVARAVLDALARQDRATLDALALGEQEFKDHVWPDLPAARPERNLPLSYVWGDLHQKSRLALSETLERHGGRHYELQDVAFAGETKYAGYTVHRTATLHVRDDSGVASAIRVCGSMLEMDGAWKVFSYVVDE